MLRNFQAILVVILSLWLGAHFPVFAQPASAEFEVKTVATGLNFPWGMAFLPDGRLLVTERVGRLRIVSPDGSVSDPLLGVPAVYSEKQGGLLDVAIDPDFARNRTIYLSYAERQGRLAGTAVARAELVGLALKNLQVIFRQQPKTRGAQHFGSRLVFAPDGNLFITLGDRAEYMREAERIENHLGTLVRIRPDGTVPDDNPFVKNPQAKPEIWSYGHRNIQGAARHPKTGAVWIHEHGPRGGDEINIPKPGKNYGWPEASYGTHYWMAPIKDEHAEQGFEEPIYYWTPSIAPSGMAFYTGELFPAWRGNLFVGALAGKQLVRLVTDGERIVQEEQLLKNYARIRDVEQGPDGALYLLTDEVNGKLIKLVPKVLEAAPQSGG
ncbi:PQQ-dependent sugar dehydrogenase [Nitrosomonas halophila]|uniref:Glucose/arabinose dehydrogenase, beta-propeller fold n=1 Tax=Nitrosomonas halophila TaxID=44576 RepID=A0A1H3JLH4_9PROT|nr:PQQ-dependent sugar dehydrogenase [Nitrosomonas halophila]SDY40840.1 Glucose/arabinose dehydrogenase, beta-propeller fold [Nitrosomonas halophila]